MSIGSYFDGNALSRENMSVICIDEILEKDQERQKALELDELEELDEYELWDLHADEILNGSGLEILR